MLSVANGHLEAGSCAEYVACARRAGPDRTSWAMISNCEAILHGRGGILEPAYSQGDVSHGSYTSRRWKSFKNWDSQPFQTEYNDFLNKPFNSLPHDQSVPTSLPPGESIGAVHTKSPKNAVLEFPSLSTLQSDGWYSCPTPSCDKQEGFAAHPSSCSHYAVTPGPSDDCSGFVSGQVELNAITGDTVRPGWSESRFWDTDIRQIGKIHTITIALPNAAWIDAEHRSISVAYCDGADIQMLDSRDSASLKCFDKELEVRSRESLEEVDSVGLAVRIKVRARPPFEVRLRHLDSWESPFQGENILDWASEGGIEQHRCCDPSHVSSASTSSVSFVTARSSLNQPSPSADGNSTESASLATTYTKDLREWVEVAESDSAPPPPSNSSALLAILNSANLSSSKQSMPTCAPPIQSSSVETSHRKKQQALRHFAASSVQIANDPWSFAENPHVRDFSSIGEVQEHHPGWRALSDTPTKALPMRTASAVVSKSTGSAYAGRTTGAAVNLSLDASNGTKQAAKRGELYDDVPYIWEVPGGRLADGPWCPLCNESFVHEWSYNCHVTEDLSHLAKLDMVASGGRKSPGPPPLKRPVLSHGQSAPRNARFQPLGQKQYCDKCRRHFHTPWKLQRHLKESKFHPYYCRTCTVDWPSFTDLHSVSPPWSLLDHASESPWKALR